MKSIILSLCVMIAVAGNAHAAESNSVVEVVARKLALSGNQHGVVPEISHVEIEKLHMAQNSASTVSEIEKVAYLMGRIAELPIPSNTESESKSAENDTTQGITY